jgi:hypothetical protein
VAAVVRLVLLAADGGSPVVIQSRTCVGGHPFIMTDYEDLKLFVTIRPSAAAWLPWSLPSPTSTPAVSSDASDGDREGGESSSPCVLCIHVRDGMMGY